MVDPPQPKTKREPRQPKTPRRPSPRGPRLLVCANCQAEFSTPARLRAFCSQQCRDVAKAVRYGRSAATRFGSNAPEDVEYALKIKVAHALGGGYDQQARTLSAETRELVIERDQGRCVACGGTGEEIDHIDGPSDSLPNLALMCAACHRAKTARRLRSVDEPQAQELLRNILHRIGADEPLLPCDAPDWRHARWQWMREHERLEL